MKNKNLLQQIKFGVILAAAWCLAITMGTAQVNINMPYNINGGTFFITPPTICSYNFFDNGGAAGAYSAGSSLNSIITFCPSIPANKINVAFSSFSTEAGWDGLYVFDGNSVASPQIIGPSGALFNAPAGSWSGGVAPGNVSPNNIRATGANASGCLTFRFFSDASVTCPGWASVVSEIPTASCVMTAPTPAVVTVAVGANCLANATVNSPTFAPAGCAAMFQLQYSVDGGPFTVVSTNPVPPTVTIPNIAVGAHTVTWQLVNPCGGAIISSSTQTINAADLTGPVIACIPDLTINLNVGECNAKFTFNPITATDNCPYFGNATTVTFPATIFPDQGGAFTWAGNNLPGGNFFDLTNSGTQSLAITNFWIRFGSAATGVVPSPQQMDVYYTTSANTYVGNAATPAAWTKLPTSPTTVAGPNGEFSIIPMSVALNLTPGQKKGIHIVGLTACPLYNTGPNSSFTPIVMGSLTLTPGQAASGPFQPQTTPRTPNVRVSYALPGPIPVTQTGGLLNGALFPIGKNCLTFTATDQAGNTSTCSFCVTVNEYPAPAGQQLSCIGNVQISVDQNCTARIGGDDLLTGGPYGCLDKYIVEVYQNGKLIPGSPNVTFKCGGNNTYTAKVIDPVNPNNACWSNVTVEDKLPPVLACIDQTVACGADLTPGAQSVNLMVMSTNVTPLPFKINDGLVANTAQDVALNVAGLPATMAGVTVKVDMEATHSWIGLLQAKLVAPDGTVVPLFDNIGDLTTGTCKVLANNSGNSCDNLNLSIFDAAPNPYSTLQTLCVAGSKGCGQAGPFDAVPGPPYAAEGSYQPEAPLGTGLANITTTNGTWILRLSHGPFYSGVTLTANHYLNLAKLTFSLPGSPFLYNPNPNTVDACGPATVTYSDKYNFVNNCVGPYVSQLTRTWTATDCSGNKAQCTQLINILKADLTTLVYPPNYDNITNPAFACTSPYPTPDWIESQGLDGYPGGQGCNIQSTYVDQVINVCQNSYKVIRTWTVLDWCTGAIGTAQQVIKVLDTVGPTLTCPTADQILIQSYNKANPYQACTAHVLLPWIPISDNCSTFNNIDVVVSTKDATGKTYAATDPGADSYFEMDLPLGNYTFTYCATDDCGNVTCCSVDKQLKDLTEPVAICESYHQVSLTDSITWVNAEAFDDGSFDVCGPVTFLARRLDNPKCQGNDATPFAAQVPFYCCDAKGGTDVTVELRVIDVDGNFNTCWSTVHVEDKIRPLITCPPDILVWCGQPYTPSNYDTTIVHNQINGKISSIYSHKYQYPLTVQGFPKGSTIADLDVHLDITHEYTNDLEVTLFNPFGVKATILTPNAFPGCYGANINNTFNDQAYDIDYFNATGIKIPAYTVCSQTKDPSIGSYNVGTYPNGQTRPQGDHLKGFNGYPLNNVNSKSFANVQYNEIDVAKNRMSNFEIFNLLNGLGLVKGQHIILRYDGPTSGGTIAGLEAGSYYTWLIIDPFTLELLPENSTDITSVPVGSSHKFTWSSIWLLQVYDTKVLGGGTVNSIDLHIAWGLPTALKPVASDNAQECGLMITWSDLDQPDPCYNNVIRRRWVATDMFTNSRNCIQRISFQDETPWVIQFPCDVTITCDNTNNPFPTFNINDYLASHQPVHSGDCESVGIESIVHELTVVPDACRKYIVHWKVIDWCTFDINNTALTNDGIALSYDELIEWFPNLPWHNQCDYFIPGFPFNIRAFEDDGDGYFDQIQYIKLIDKSKPVFTNCKDTTICAYGACNADVTLTTVATDVCTDAALIKYSYKVDAFNDGTTELTGTGNTFTGNVPFGKHRITWTATDGCGNYTTCSYIFYVKDCKKPTPVCINGLSAPNMPVQKVVTIWATDWESGSSYDNCCAFDDLVHRVIKTGESDHQTPPTSTSVTFGCTEIGSQPVEVWVGDCGYDENGDGVITDNERNWDFCNTFILVTDNNLVCDSLGTMAAVAGGVETETGKMVNGVNMTAIASGYNQTTSANGQFNFLLEKGKPYTIVPAKDVNPLNGVNTLDLVYITNHILGKKALTSAYKKIAADINKDKSITTGDLVQLRQLILHITNAFPVNTSWRFVDKAYTFTTNKEQAESFPEVVTIPSLNTAKSVNFIGVKVGDVTNDANPANATSVNEVRSGGTLTLGVAEQDLVAGQEYKVNFTARDFNNMAGYQFTIGYDVNTLDFVGLEGKAADINGENFGLTNLENGMITTSWNGKSLTTLKSDDVLFTLTFKANTSGKLSKAINVNSNLTPAIAFNGNEEAMDVALQFNTNNGVVSASEFELYQNQPNPFKEFTTISFTLPQASKATLTIYDVAGKVVKAINGDYNKGLNNVNIQRSDIPAAGVLYYQLDTDTNSAVKKMIIIE